MEAGAIASREAALVRVSVSRLSARIGLAGIVALSFVLRAIATIPHSSPRYMPDEYIYSALGRSIAAHGRPLIRGHLAHFPALLEPIVAAPLWALAPLGVAYRLVQLENVLFMSLAAIPAFLLARELRLSERYALLCAAFAVASPDLIFSTYVSADPVAYPLVLSALYAGLVALGRTTTRSEIAFVAFAGLATAARVQYVVLFAAFAVAAILLERRRVLRAHVVFASAAAIGLACGLALGPSRLLGYYSAILHDHFGLSILEWALTDLFLLALVSGAVLVPGAVVGLLRPRGKSETAFSLLVAAFAVALLFEAGLYATNGSQRFQERYLFTLLPVLPVAFGLYARRARPGRLPQLVVAAALMLALPLLPVSGYAFGRGDTDSPFLFAVVRLGLAFGSAGSSLIVAAAATAALALGLVPWVRSRAGAAVFVAVMLMSLMSVGAAALDARSSRSARTAYVAQDPSWVDALHLRNVAAVQTPDAPPWFLLNQLFWNDSVTSELVLSDAQPSDLFAATRVRVARDGTLRTQGGTVIRSPIMIQNYALSATLTGAVQVARANTYTVWKPAGTPRFKLAALGRYSDGWLAWTGRITVWPNASGFTRGTIAFTVSLPQNARPLDLKFVNRARTIHRRVHLSPGQRTRLRFDLSGRGPQTIAFASSTGGFDADMRKISARATMPTFMPAR